MFLQGEDTEQYPQFTAYLYYRFPSVKESSTIVKNMGTYGKLSKSAFLSALTPGMPPFIKIEARNLQGGNGSEELGRFKRNSPGYIYLSQAMVARFDADPWDDRNFFSTPKGKRVPVIGAVLLHFLTHYGYYKAGMACRAYECGGLDFEVATYDSTVYYWP
jgi:hypothetical protein